MMTTADLALKMDPAYRKLSEHFLHHPRNSPMPLRVPGSS